MKHDRFLQGILIFIVLMVIIALGIFILRGNDQSYGPDDSPEGVVVNYALALQNMDFERAFDYLADNTHKPDFETFRYSFLNQRLDTTNASIQIGATRISETDEAYVEVSVIYSSSDLFASPNSRGEIVTLTKQSQGWKITSMPHPYWGWDWYKP